MSIVIKNPKTDAEIKGKAYVHYKSWQEAYPGIVDQEYLDTLTIEKCEAIAFKWRDNILIAKDGERVVGFVGYGEYRSDELHDAGEIFAIYVLSEYYGQDVGRRLMNAALEMLDFSQVAVWVLKDNARAIRFYEKCGFCFDGREETITLGTPVTEIRMILKRGLDFDRLLCELNYPDSVESAVKSRLFDLRTREVAATAYDANDPEKFDFPLCRRMPLTRLTVVTHLLRRKYDDYKAKGVSDRIIFDTFADVSLRAALYYEKTGKVGISREDVIWFRHIMNVAIFKIGVLQYQPFEMIYLDKETIGEPYMVFSPEQKASLPSGTPVINCHIQRRADLDHQKVGRSMSDAEAFFKKIFSDKRFCAFLCYSWLLYPQMTERLPADSRIRRFATRFCVIGACGDREQAVDNLFDGEKPSADRAKTSLQRLAAEHIEYFGYACGVRYIPQ